jgi:hypothetical protein
MRRPRQGMLAFTNHLPTFTAAVYAGRVRWLYWGESRSVEEAFS